ncbi:MAG: ATP-grasp domain-containing protein [Phycisphaerae bacterium]
MKKLRILALMDESFVPPDSIGDLTAKQAAPFKTEYDVVSTLRSAGHQVHILGVAEELKQVRHAIRDFGPHLVFNLLEEFQGVGIYVQNIVAYLELMRVPYTGCNPQGLILAHDKALCKKLLTYHRIRVPAFAVFRLGQKVRRPKRLSFPLFVKSLTEEGSAGISQTSIVNDDDKLCQRVAFIHEQLRTDAIAEQYIEGRELYVSILGNRRLQTLPIWEMLFTNLPDNAPRIATAKVKWDLDYQEKTGIVTQAAKDLDPALTERILRICKRAYRVLRLSGYARLDLRLTPQGQVYVLEANPNPQVADGEELAEAAEADGMSYGQLLQRIVQLGLSYRPDWQL